MTSAVALRGDMSGDELWLFDYAARFVMPADVAAFAPGDPGYPDYVATFNRILSSGVLPDRSAFDVTETIGLTCWTDADRERDPFRFRRYRVLTSVVGLLQVLAGVEAVDVLPPNYLVASLLNDAYRLDDRTLVQRSRPVFADLHRCLARSPSEESPFALLGTLLADAYLGADHHHLSELSDQLIREEQSHFDRLTGDFLLGCSYFDQLHGLWQWLVDQLVPPATPALRLVRDAILGSGPWPEVVTR